MQLKAGHTPWSLTTSHTHAPFCMLGANIEVALIPSMNITIERLKGVLIEQLTSEAPYALVTSNRSIPSSVSNVRKPRPGILSISGIGNHLSIPQEVA